MTVAVSLIISTYNRLDALKAVLDSVTRQQVYPLEVLVADDGSTQETAEYLKSVTLPCALLHIWQVDDGYRLATIRNRAAVQAQGDYLIFIDGDCVMRPDFIANHLRLAEARWFVAGHRLLLSEPFTQQVLQAEASLLTFPRLLQARLSGGLNRLLPLLSLPDGHWRRRKPTDWRLARGCNLGVWREDFIAVNGFEERFNGWGYEDSDFAIRLIRCGVHCKSGRFATGVFHLWHRENDRSRERTNHALLQASLVSSQTRAELGLSQYLAVDG
ncbi:Glycosyltransferase, GT2 family [Thiothrix caldifontis]|uniref:Glycosyltransferase, GT2 family n=1 Tax=Thiothrix caldifontis TaxID=525918 RepID=A0A1H3VUX6_9GAMM|nr:glycosyltransferase family 2 protein [Thiothrix caldifontis]SDZ78645.1 Glycosyltransferase, GT2 family [Thiothrix caldifontis]